MADKNMNISIKTIASTIGCMVTAFSLVCVTQRAAIADSDIEDKTSQFDEFLDDVNEEMSVGAESELAAKIRQQRAALSAQAARATNNAKSSVSSGKNECDQKLRACMRGKCGDDFSKCAGDTDTLWGDKMDLCRMDTKCTGEEYKLFTTEIKADRDLNAELSFYNATIKCGNEYNDCVIAECGPTFTKCLGKTAGDAAIQKCSKIAQKCTEQDSGLPSRMMEAFGNLRGNAEKAIVRDEKRLYELRDAMRDTCGRLGAMFDERSLDCVYTVEFYAGEDNTLYASKKAYAGSTFSCTQNWFGVDITTFKENAFRLTRAQTSASSAAFGSGVGMAVGAITSGAIDRAIDRAKAERALGEELCDQSDGEWQKALNRCKCPDGTKWDDEEGCLIQDEEDVADDEEEAADQAEEAADKKDLENALTSLSEEDLKAITDNPDIEKIAKEEGIDLDNIKISDVSKLLNSGKLDLESIDTSSLPEFAQKFLQKKTERAKKKKNRETRRAERKQQRQEAHDLNKAKRKANSKKGKQEFMENNRQEAQKGLNKLKEKFNTPPSSKN